MSNENTKTSSKRSIEETEDNEVLSFQDLIAQEKEVKCYSLQRSYQILIIFRAM